MYYSSDGSEVVPSEAYDSSTMDTVRHFTTSYTLSNEDCFSSTVDLFVSGARLYKFVEYVAAIEEYFLQVKDKATTSYLWLDFLVHNHWSEESDPFAADASASQGRVYLSFEWWNEQYPTVIRDISPRCLLLLPWNVVVLTTSMKNQHSKQASQSSTDGTEIEVESKKGAKKGMSLLPRDNQKLRVVLLVL